MTTCVDIQTSPMSVQELIALARAGNDVVLVEGEIAIARVTAIPQPQEARPRIAGLNRCSFWIDETFNDSLPDSFWLGEYDE